ncbi:hypothetical protein ALP12_200277 [Pseudomonas savastanoi pv. phaseolicola]|nr:hypothetical protein ALP12_200277 [Pseudomonas savastanoi pv. phaseolicola]
MILSVFSIDLPRSCHKPAPSAQCIEKAEGRIRAVRSTPICTRGVKELPQAGPGIRATVRRPCYIYETALSRGYLDSDLVTNERRRL